MGISQLVDPRDTRQNVRDSLIMMAINTAHAVWFLKEPTQPCCSPYLLTCVAASDYSVFVIVIRMSLYIPLVERRKNVIKVMHMTKVTCARKSLSEIITTTEACAFILTARDPIDVIIITGFCPHTAFVRNQRLPGIVDVSDADNSSRRFLTRGEHAGGS